MGTIKIVNPKQCAFYINGGYKPLDLYVDKATGRLIYLYDANETKELWQEWKNTKPIK